MLTMILVYRHFQWSLEMPFVEKSAPLARDSIHPIEHTKDQFTMYPSAFGLLISQTGISVNKGL